MNASVLSAVMIRSTSSTSAIYVICANEEVFEPFIPSPEWVRGIFDAVERSRNVIIHSGVLDPEDIDRVGVNVRNWVRQVGVLPLAPCV